VATNKAAMADRTTTYQEYLSGLEPERVEAMNRISDVIQRNIPKGFEHAMGYGMPGFMVPHSLYPSGYHCDPKLPLPFIGYASQKNFVAIYHMGLYADPVLCKWFTDEYAKRVPGKLDMGKSCIRFKKPDQIPYDLLAELVAKMTVADWIKLYESELKK